MIYEKVKDIIRPKAQKQQAIITITAAVDVDPNSHIPIERQAMNAVLEADGMADSLDGLEFEEVLEVRAHE